jgi:hypothetical protein
MVRKILGWGLLLVVIVAIAQDPSGTGATVHGWFSTIGHWAGQAGTFVRSAAGH